MNYFEEIFKNMLNEKNESFENQLNNFFKDDNREIFDKFELWAKKNKNQIDKILTNNKFDIRNGEYQELITIFYSFIKEKYNKNITNKIVLKIASDNKITNHITVLRMIGEEIGHIFNKIGINIKHGN